MKCSFAILLGSLPSLDRRENSSLPSRESNPHHNYNQVPAPIERPQTQQQPIVTPARHTIKVEVHRPVPNNHTEIVEEVDNNVDGDDVDGNDVGADDDVVDMDDDVQEEEEPPIEITTSQEDAAEDEDQFTVIAGGSQRGNDILIDKRGFIFSIKRQLRGSRNRK